MRVPRLTNLGLFNERQRDLAIVHQIAVETPLIEIEDRMDGDNTLLLKMESYQPVRSFKIRGATYAMARNLQEFREHGIVADSGGNHSQGVALAGRYFHVPVKIIMSSLVPDNKVNATKSFGANDGTFEIDTSPADFVIAKERAKESAINEGRIYLSPYDNEDIIRGQATLATEVYNQLKKEKRDWPDGFHVAVGGGGMISGIADVSSEQGHVFNVYGHETTGADSATRSFYSDTPIPVDGVLSTHAEGLSVQAIGDRPFQRFKDGKIDGMYVVSVPEIGEAYDWYEHHVLPQLGINIHDMNEVWSHLPEVSAMVAIAGLIKYIRTTHATHGTHLTVISGANIDRDKAKLVMNSWHSH